MGVVVYIGDEVGAAGYRLAGAVGLTPRPGDEAAALCQAREQASLVLLSAAAAAAIGETALRGPLAALQPLLLIVPDLVGEVPLPDLAARLRAQLGMEA